MTEQAGTPHRRLEVTWDGPAIAVRVPRHWGAEVRSTPDLLLLSWDTTHKGAGRTCTTTLTAEPLPESHDMATWQLEAEAIMARAFADWQVLDVAVPDASWWSAYRLSRYAATSTDQVTVAQWMKRIGTWGLTLSVCGSSADYARWFHLGDLIAESVEIDE